MLRGAMRRVLALVAAAAVVGGVAAWEMDLGGEWRLANSAGNVTGSGTVPGTVHTDLLALGVIEDPFYRFNDWEYNWIPNNDWTYTRLFDVRAARC